MSVNSKMTTIADAIRNLLDISGTMGLDAMANNISSITKRGAVAGTISTKSEQYIIPAGYHNGNGTVGIADAEQAKIIAENIKNGVTILGVSGTASGDIYAIIAVTYPAGSTCTCSDGTTTLTARDTSGKALFNVPSAGTWTVSCTDGSSTVSKSVTITATGQVESVKLSYDLILYDSGEEYSDITGGWSGFACYSGTSKGTFTKNSSSIYIKSNGSKGAQSIAAAPANKIDITNISTLKVNVTSFNVQSEYRSYFLLSSSRDTSSVSNAAASIEIKGTGEIALDVSSLSGSYYVIVYTRAVDGANTYELTFNRVYGT